MEEDKYKKVMEEVEEVKKSPVVNSTTEALLLMIYQAVDKIRYHNTD